jgi:hypothetical protein
MSEGHFADVRFDIDGQSPKRLQELKGLLGAKAVPALRDDQNINDLENPKLGRYRLILIKRPQDPFTVFVGLGFETPRHGYGSVEDKSGHRRPSAIIFLRLSPRNDLPRPNLSIAVIASRIAAVFDS